MSPQHTPDYLAHYDRMADRAASAVIAAYSTSFGVASQLLAPQVRRDIRNLYAMVRIADEIVDGTAKQARIDDISATLDTYEAQVRTAPQLRFHTDPVLHAYAQTARHCHFQDEHIAEFFSSMRADLHRTTYTDASLQDYIRGSAEVIGLLCLSIFLANTTTAVSTTQYEELEDGARILGAAFQKINFLRDYAEDAGTLGRRYFPGTERTLTEQTKDAIVAEIRVDLAQARTVIPLLPLSARVGVLAATNLFAELTERIDDVSADYLQRHRISIPQHRKATIVASALVQAPRMKPAWRPNPSQGGQR